MKKKGYRARRRKNSSKKSKHTMRCFRCHIKNHLIAKCPYDSNDKDAIKKEKKKQEKKKSSHKKNDSYVAIWDSDDSSSDDEDDNKSKKKGHASIAIQETVSLFDTSSCFMVKAAKVSSNDESDHDNASDSDSDNDSDEEEFTKDELITMLEDCTQHFKESRKECKGLLKEKKTLCKKLMSLGHLMRV
jgi:hypothetical protein